VKKDITILVALMLTMVSFFAAQEQLTGNVIHECTDSDNGMIYATKGTVTAGNEVLVDSCEDQILTEYYCSQNQVRIKVYSCPESCEQGRCTQQLTTTPQESLRLGTTTNRIEIGEYLGDVIDTVTNAKTPSLRSTTISTGRATTLANQYLRFKGTDLLSGRILFTEDNKNEVADFLVFEENNDTFEYELEFVPGLASTLASTTLTDLANEEIFMLGRTYTITEATKNSDQLTLRLLSGAISDTLREGEEKIYTLNGQEYTVKVKLIEDEARAVTLEVNKQISGRRSVGDVETLAGIPVGITKMLVSEAAEQEDQVTFTLGAQTLEFTDRNVADDSFSQGVSIDGRSLANTFVKIKGSGDDTEYSISSLQYRLRAESLSGDNVFIPAGKGLREMTRYEQALLGDWDILYRGLDAARTKIKFDPGNSRYDLEFVNTKGQQIDTTLITNENNNLKIGKENQALHFIEGTSITNFIIARDDQFILTTENNRQGITNIVQYNSIDTTNKQLAFEDLAEGRKDVQYTGTEGTDAAANLVINGNSYQVHIGGAPNYNLAIDLNQDGDVNSDEVNIIVQGGGMLDLGTTITPNNDFSLTLTTEASQFDGASSDETITINVQETEAGVDLDLPAQNTLTIETRTGKKLAMSTYGVFLKQETDNPDELSIDYPLQQAVGHIEIVFAQQEQGATIQPSTKKFSEQAPAVVPKTIQAQDEPTILPEIPEAKIYYEEQPTGFSAWIKKMWKTITNWFA